MKGSKIQVKIDKDKRKNSSKHSGAESVSSMLHPSTYTSSQPPQRINNLTKKRSSVDANIRLKNTLMPSRVTTPSNIMINKVSRNLRARKLFANSSSRGTSLNTKKLKKSRIESKKPRDGLDQKFRTAKVKSSRNRSVSTRLKLVTFKLYYLDWNFNKELQKSQKDPDL